MGEVVLECTIEELRRTHQEDTGEAAVRHLLNVYVYCIETTCM